MKSYDEINYLHTTCYLLRLLFIKGHVVQLDTEHWTALRVIANIYDRKIKDQNLFIGFPLSLISMD